MKEKSISRLIHPLAVLLLPFFFGVVFPFSPAEGGGNPAAVKDQPRQQTTGPHSATAALDALSDSAEEIYQLTLAGKAERAGKRLEEVKKDVNYLASLQNQSSDILLPRLTHTVVGLEQAWNARDRLETMRYANRITLIAATLAVPLKPRIPTEVSLLDYNCRELAIWSEAKRPEKLSNIVMRMHLAWQTLMPKLIEHDGIRELRRFSDIMGHLELARTADDYARLSRQVSPEIETMRAIFSRPK